MDMAEMLTFIKMYQVVLALPLIPTREGIDHDIPKEVVMKEHEAAREQIMAAA